jgi:hypothetical protein
MVKRNSLRKPAEQTQTQKPTAVRKLNATELAAVVGGKGKGGNRSGSRYARGGINY